MRLERGFRLGGFLERRALRAFLHHLLRSRRVGIHLLDGALDELGAPVVALFGRDVARRLTLAVDSGDVGASAEQQGDDVFVSAAARGVKRSRALTVDGLDVQTALEERVDDVVVTFSRREVQRRGAVIRLFVDDAPSLDQTRDDGGVALGRGDV